MQDNWNKVMIKDETNDVICHDTNIYDDCMFAKIVINV